MTSSIGSSPPTVCVLGATGVGKGATLNSCFGTDRFGTSFGAASHTIRPQLLELPWRGRGPLLRGVDLCGFSDSEGRDSDFLGEMVRCLKEEVGQVHCFLLLLNSQEARVGRHIKAASRCHYRYVTAITARLLCRPPPPPPPPPHTFSSAYGLPSSPRTCCSRCAPSLATGSCGTSFSASRAGTTVAAAACSASNGTLSRVDDSAGSSSSGRLLRERGYAASEEALRAGVNAELRKAVGHGHDCDAVFLDNTQHMRDAAEMHPR